MLGYRHPDDDAPRSEPASRPHTLLAFLGFALYGSLFAAFLLVSLYVGGRRRSTEGRDLLLLAKLREGAGDGLADGGGHGSGVRRR